MTSRALAADARHLARERDRLRLLASVRWAETLAALERFLDAQEELRALDERAEDAREFLSWMQAADRWRPTKE